MRPLRVAILYGSQTGNAQSIAEGVNDTCKQKGLESTLLACDGWKKLKPELKEWNAVIIVVSTTGNGDSPENTERFWRFLKRRTQPADLLEGLPFALLGLGDTNYDKFCHMGKSFDKRLRELGATSFHPSAFADEATNMEETVEPWLSALYPAILALRSGGNDPAAGTVEVEGEGVAVPAAPPIGLENLPPENSAGNSGEKAGGNNVTSQGAGSRNEDDLSLEKEKVGTNETVSLSVASVANGSSSGGDAAAGSRSQAQVGVVVANSARNDRADAETRTEIDARSAKENTPTAATVKNQENASAKQNGVQQVPVAIEGPAVEPRTHIAQAIKSPNPENDVLPSREAEASPLSGEGVGGAMDVAAAVAADESGKLPPHRIAILYGSQTGNAQSIAERVHEGCKERGFDSTFFTCDSWKKMKPELKEWTALVLVVSTTGNGDAPENTERFWRFIKRRSQPKDLLEGLPFTVLGLGDTNYDKFCWIGKSMDKRLRELGAKALYPPAFADEATTMEDTVEPWVANLYAALGSLVVEVGKAPQEETTSSDRGTPAKSPLVPTAETIATIANGPTPKEGVLSKNPSAESLSAIPAGIATIEGGDVHRVEAAGIDAVDTVSTSMLGLSVISGVPTVAPASASAAENGAHGQSSGSGTVVDMSAVGLRDVENEKEAENLTTTAAAAVATTTTSTVGLATSAGDNRLANSDDTAPIAAEDAAVSKSWSPSEESCILPLTRFLDSEHLAPAYSPPRDDLPRLRQSAPDVHFFNLEDTSAESVLRGGVDVGGGKQGPGDAWLRRAIHRSSSVDSGHTSDWPFASKVLAARYLTEGGRQADRRVILLQLSLKDSGITYEPGDVIGIRCPNPACQADYILERLQGTLPPGAGPDEPFHHSLRSLPSPCTLRDALVTRLDLQAALRKPVIRALADFCQDEQETAWMELLCAKTRGAEVYAKFVSAQSLTLCELLEAFPSCKPTAGALLALLPPLPPRYYSVASSQVATPHSLDIAFSVVSYEVPVPISHGADGRGAGGQVIRRHGLCTNWLEEMLTPSLQKAEQSRKGFTVNGRRLPGGDVEKVEIPLFMKPTKEFLLPASAKWPCVLIGPGTGVAPFVGFLKHREAQFARRRQTVDAVCSGTWRGGYEISLEGEEDEAQAYRGREGRGDMWLFFGCRHKNQDWVFRKDMEAFLSKGTLTRLKTAFSRDPPKKVYVQDRIQESGAELARLMLHEGAYVFVCGDGNSMAQGVHNALVQVLVEHGGQDVRGQEGAEAVLKAMKARSRYVLDVWS